METSILYQIYYDKNNNMLMTSEEINSTRAKKISKYLIEGKDALYVNLNYFKSLKHPEMEEFTMAKAVIKTSETVESFKKNYQIE